MTRDELLFAAPLRLEARALRRGLRNAATPATVIVTGMGPRRSAASAERLRSRGADTIVVAGFAGALAGLEPGELVVAREVVGPDGDIEPCAAGPELADALTRAGLTTRLAPVASSRRLVRGGARQRLAATGAVAVDMESWWLVDAKPAGRTAVVRAVVDTSQRELSRPLATVTGGIRAYRNLSRAAAAISGWHSQAPWRYSDRDMSESEPCQSR